MISCVSVCACARKGHNASRRHPLRVVLRFAPNLGMPRSADAHNTVGACRSFMPMAKGKSDINSTSILKKHCRVLIFGYGLSSSMKNLTWKDLTTLHP